MAKGKSSNTGVTERYASAAFELARDSKVIDAMSADLQKVAEMIASSPDLTRLVRSPVFSIEEQTSALGAILDRAEIGGLAGNFVRLVARNRRLFALPEMIVAFRRLVAAHRGETTAAVASAEPLSDTQVEALKSALREKLGREVSLDLSVDPALIGGLVVKVGSRMIDTSLKTKLNQLKIAMKEVR